MSTLIGIRNIILAKLKEKASYLQIPADNIMADIDQPKNGLKAPSIVVFAIRRPVAKLHNQLCDIVIFLYLKNKTKAIDTHSTFEDIRDRIQKLIDVKLRISVIMPNWDTPTIQNNHISGLYKFQTQYTNGAPPIV